MGKYSISRRTDATDRASRRRAHGMGLAFAPAVRRPMLARLLSATVLGVEAKPVEVEVTTRGAPPNLVIVGLPDTAVKESKERVFSSLQQAHFALPPALVVVNLAPADLKKEGTAFDLPIALAVLAAHHHIPPDAFADTVILGELALDGHVRPVPGVLAIVADLRRAGYKRFLVPHENAPEGAVVEGVEIYGVRHFLEAVYHFRGERRLERELTVPFSSDAETAHRRDMREVRSHRYAKRALEVAAAGAHNVLLVGPPGSGKTMLAQRLPTILPPLSREEAVETSRIHSIAGFLNGRSLVTQRPFRAPHHTISYAGLVGGGTIPRPGEISMAHHGVLFLDELPEFSRSVLEVLRQPLETGRVTVARAALTLTFPARFMLVAAMNPCPCGYYGSRLAPCHCTPGRILRYLRKISGPLLDRIDLHIEIPALAPGELEQAADGEPSATIRARVCRARRRQWRRYADSPLRCNAELDGADLDRFCEMTPAARRLLRTAMQHRRWSARVYHRLVKIARTIADLEDAATIDGHHIAEAVQYRSPNLMQAGPEGEPGPFV